MPCSYWPLLLECVRYCSKLLELSNLNRSLHTLNVAAVSVMFCCSAPYQSAPSCSSLPRRTLFTFTVNIIPQFPCCSGLCKYMLQPQKWSKPFCIVVVIKSESTVEQRFRASWLVSGLVIFGIDNCSLVSNKTEDSMHWKVCSWTAEACVVRLPMPPVFEGEVGGAELLANVRLVGSWLWGRKVGILPGFVW